MTSRTVSNLTLPIEKVKSIVFLGIIDKTVIPKLFATLENLCVVKQYDTIFESISIVFRSIINFKLKTIFPEKIGNI